MPARRLELAVEASELVVHPVDVRRQRAELVAVRHVEAPEKSPDGDLGEPRLGPPDRPDQRPESEEAEQEREATDAAATPT